MLTDADPVLTVPTVRTLGGPATPGSLTSTTEFRDGEEITTVLRFALVTSTVLIQVVLKPLLQLLGFLMINNPNHLRNLVQKGQIGMSQQGHC